MPEQYTEIPQDIIRTLDVFSLSLRQCIEQEDWDNLIILLTERQNYFEQIFEHSEPMDLLKKKNLIQQVLSEDNELVDIVTQQKNRVERERLDLARSRQAIKAYE